MKGVPQRRAQSYVQISCVSSFYLNVKWLAKSECCVCVFSSTHIHLLLDAYNLIQWIFKQTYKYVLREELIELRDFTLLTAKSKRQNGFHHERPWLFNFCLILRIVLSSLFTEVL